MLMRCFRCPFLASFPWYSHRNVAPVGDSIISSTRKLLYICWRFSRALRNGAEFPAKGWICDPAPGPRLVIGVPTIVLFQVLARITMKTHILCTFVKWTMSCSCWQGSTLRIFSAGPVVFFYFFTFSKNICRIIVFSVFDPCNLAIHNLNAWCRQI